MATKEGAYKAKITKLETLDFPIWKVFCSLVRQDQEIARHRVYG